MLARSALMAGVAVLLPSLVHAQSMDATPGIISDDFRLQYDRGRNDSVRERARPGFEPAGMRLGAFNAAATLQGGLTSTSNILRTPTDEIAVEGYSLGADASLASTWSRHALSIYGAVGSTGYSSVEDANNISREVDSERWSVGANGRIDIQRNQRIQISASHNETAVERGALGLPTDTIRPNMFSTTNLSIGYGIELTRVRLSLRAVGTRQDFDDNQLVNGTVIDLDDRDSETINVIARGDYAISPALAVFAQLSHVDQTFDNTPVGRTPRDQQTLTALVGTNFDIGGLARGEIGVGYARQEFEQPLFTDRSRFSYRGAVEWFPTRLVTISAAASRSAEAGLVTGTGATVRDSYALQADYEFRRNIIVTGRTTYTVSEVDVIDRSEERLNTSVSVAWLVNRTAALSFTFNQSEAESDGGALGTNFEDTSLGIQLTLRR
jgi:hypothetical protein